MNLLILYKKGSDSMADMHEFSVALSKDLQDELEKLKKGEYSKMSDSDFLKLLINVGIETVKKDKMEEWLC